MVSSRAQAITSGFRHLTWRFWTTGFGARAELRARAGGCRGANYTEVAEVARRGKSSAGWNVCGVDHIRFELLERIGSRGRVKGPRQLRRTVRGVTRRALTDLAARDFRAECDENSVRAPIRHAPQSNVVLRCIGHTYVPIELARGRAQRIRGSPLPRSRRSPSKERMRLKSPLGRLMGPHTLSDHLAFRICRTRGITASAPSCLR